MKEKMYCNQCQETASCTACTQVGVCGKKPETAGLQDILIHVTKGLAEVVTALTAAEQPVETSVYNRMIENLFITITNANFDDAAITAAIQETGELRETLAADLTDRRGLRAALWQLPTAEEMGLRAWEVSLKHGDDEDVRSLRSLILYGLKGMAAYLKHADALGKRDEDINRFMAQMLAALSDDERTVAEYIEDTLATGEYGVRAMALLDAANTEAYGHPEISTVDIGVRNNPGILISGHDLKDLEMLLEQTAGTGVDVYTHSEMLPAHYYPAFKKYDHFAGNYGNAWWAQTREFEAFNGPILMTTNCLVPPKASYKSRVYTTGTVGFTGCPHIEATPDGKKDFTAVIEHAKRCAAPTELEQGSITGGFAHNQVMALADDIVKAVKSGAIGKFVVMAGCDGRQRGRNYYTEFAKALPDDAVILTAGCAKYRYNKLNLGDINGIPRVLDAGQCNDSYSLAVIALKLKEVFGVQDINELPIVYNIAWYEQKAVIVLLALLHLGVKNIHLGPTLPAFLSPNVVDVLVKNFGIAGISTVSEDMTTFFGDAVKTEDRIRPDMIVGEILDTVSDARDILAAHGMHCLGCPASRMETLADACAVHNLPLENVLADLNR